MSAFIVCHDHIDALLTFATAEQATSNGVEITARNATEIGRILLTENERSVSHRYPGDVDLPGTIGEEAADYTFRPVDPVPAPLAILKACECFDYQSCETDDYRDSEACKIVDVIRSRAISRLPGYSNAPGWDFRREARR